MSNMDDTYTADERALIEAAAALRVASALTNDRALPYDTTSHQDALMDLLHRMRAERLGFSLSDCGRSA